jgi:hypothetical protein
MNTTENEGVTTVEGGELYPYITSEVKRGERTLTFDQSPGHGGIVEISLEDGFDQASIWVTQDQLQELVRKFI